MYSYAGPKQCALPNGLSLYSLSCTPSFRCSFSFGCRDLPHASDRTRYQFIFFLASLCLSIRRWRKKRQLSEPTDIEIDWLYYCYGYGYIINGLINGIFFYPGEAPWIDSRKRQHHLSCVLNEKSTKANSRHIPGLGSRVRSSTNYRCPHLVRIFIGRYHPSYSPTFK